MLEVDRRQVLAYRIHAQGLHRSGADAADLAVLDLGVQDNQRDSVAIALTARLPGTVTGESLVDDPRFALAWTHRGAPHLHRASDLPGLAGAMVPLDDADAGARTGWQRGQVADSGIPASQAILDTARAVRDAVGVPTTKGALSAAVTRNLPAALSSWCGGCQARHVYEQLLRLSTLIGGTRLERGATPATFAPLERRPRMPTRPDVAAATATVAAYLRLHGPATAVDAAGFVGTSRATVACHLWLDDLAEVRVGRRTAALPRERLSALENPPEPDLVRLLPQWDPLLQARDRELLVPDKSHRAQIWKILGNPGVVLSGGEICGTWRSRASGKRLDITVTPLWTLPPRVRQAIEDEAERVAKARGLAGVRVAVR